jgi:hypothetical protein
VDSAAIREIFDSVVEEGRRGFRLGAHGRVVGYRVRDQAGRVVREHGLKDGKMHGPARYRWSGVRGDK